MSRILFLVLCHLGFISVFSQKGIAYIRVGDDLSIKFTEYSLEMCSDELWFSKVNDTTFSFSESLDYYDLAQVIKLKLKVPYDSVSVEAGYDNRYGVLYSETEGAYFYYDKSPESVLFSGWKSVKVLDPNRKYSLDCFGFGNGL